MQQKKDEYNRRHSNHEHSMTFSAPRQDSQAINIPNNTIQPLSNRSIRLPFRYLRTWIFSLLALVCLPIGIGLVIAGIDMQENLNRDWEEVTATVTRNDEDGVRYDIDNGDDGEFGYTLDYFVDANTAGELVWTVAICDLFSRFIIPKDEGSEFSLWIDPRKSSNQSCVPINQELASFYLAVGVILTGLSGIRLIRTFHAAGMRPA